VKSLYILRHPDIRVKHCAYGHSVATLLNTRCYNSFPQVQSNSCRTCSCASDCFFYLCYTENYKIKTLFQTKFKNVSKLFTLIVYYKLLKGLSYETQYVCRPRWPHIVHWSGSTVLLICSVQTTSHSKPTTLVGMYVITYVIFVWFLGAFTIKSCKNTE
jgi:hypothetical protein